MKSIIGDKFTFIRGDGNKKLIISSHGGWLSSTITLPAHLHFPAKQNYCAYGQVTNITAMSAKEFDTETQGTGGVNDYSLSNFEKDNPLSFYEVIGQGFDVVTIQKGQTVKLSEILTSPVFNLHAYTDVYCMFCRVPMQAQRIKVMF